MSLPAHARASGQGLGVADRIRRHPEFERAYSKGVRIRGRFMTLFVVPNGGMRSRFGVAATRKLGSAVQRNRAKRLAREIFRRHKIDGSFDIVVVPRREMLDEPFANLEADYCDALLRRDKAARPRPSSMGRRTRSRPASRL
jgi:ribonuclease P protein component